MLKSLNPIGIGSLICPERQTSTEHWCLIVDSLYMRFHILNITFSDVSFSALSRHHCFMQNPLFVTPSRDIWIQLTETSIKPSEADLYTLSHC